MNRARPFIFTTGLTPADAAAALAAVRVMRIIFIPMLLDGMLLVGTVIAMPLGDDDDDFPAGVCRAANAAPRRVPTLGLTVERGLRGRPSSRISRTIASRMAQPMRRSNPPPP